MARQNKQIQEIDKVVGKKIYSLRLAKGLSRQQLATIIGVTHQQLQKYEKGTNRISVGRLVLIAKALREKIDYFYQDLQQKKTNTFETKHQRMYLEISRNFMKIKNVEYQNVVNGIIKSLVKLEKASS